MLRLHGKALPAFIFENFKTQKKLDFWVLKPKIFGILGLGLGLGVGFFGFLGLGLDLGGKPNTQTQNPILFEFECLAKINIIISIVIFRA